MIWGQRSCGTVMVAWGVVLWNLVSDGKCGGFGDGMWIWVGPDSPTWCLRTLPVGWGESECVEPAGMSATLRCPQIPKGSFISRLQQPFCWDLNYITLWCLLRYEWVSLSKRGRPSERPQDNLTHKLLGFSTAVNNLGFHDCEEYIDFYFLSWKIYSFLSIF